jgi:Trypsin
VPTRAQVVAAAVGVALACPMIVAAVWPSAATGAAAPGRQSRLSNVAIAGGDVYLWSAHRSVRQGVGCTLSFAVRSVTTQRIGSLTAGHCVATLAGGPAFIVAQTRSGKGNTTDPGHHLGKVTAGEYRLGNQGDSAFVALVDHRSARRSVFTGGAASDTTISVAGFGRLRDGIHVCYSGAVSGEHCGFTVVGRPETVTFPDGHQQYRIHHEWRASRRTCTSRAGDSGSPVYIKRHGRAYAVGILSGGQKHPGTCPFFFTPVKLALARLHLRLLTGP